MKWIGKHPVFSDLLIGGVLLTPPDNQYSYELTLPNDDGTSGQVLSTNGSGVLTWVANGVAVPNALTAGTGIDYNTGTTWDGSVAKTISVDVSDFMTNGTNNYVVTATGTDAMNAEANLTFDGAKLDVAGGGTATWIVGAASSTLNTGYAYYTDLNDSLTATHNNIGLYIDYDKSGVTASGQQATLQGVKVDINDAATNHGSGTVLLKGLNACLTSANATGTIKQYGVSSELTGGDEQYGIKQRLTGATVGTTYGLWQQLDNGSNDLRFHSSADENDYFNIATGAVGATTITTVDDGAAAADLTFTVDGKITMTPADISGTVFHLDGNADTDNVVDIDSGILNVDSSGATTITAAGTAELAGSTVTLDSAANIELEVGATTNYINAGGIYRGGNIGPIADTFIPLMPIDFISSDRAGATMQVGLNGGFTGPSSDRQLYFTQKIIPRGYTASACLVSGTDANANATFICFEGDISGATPAARSSATAINSTATFSSNIVGNGEKFCTIIFTPGETADTIKGGQITIAKT